MARKLPSHISGGQKQRAAIARAIACGADVILADEPTGALDSKTGKEIIQLFSDLNAIGKTIILITHDKQIASYAKRRITIQDGRITKDEKNYTVNVENSYSEVIEIPRNTADELKITIRYNADTEGALIEKVFAHKHYFLI